MKNTSALSRRNFLKLSASALAGLAFLNLPQPAFASRAGIKKVSLADCPVDPVEVAKGSDCVQNAWSFLLETTAALKDAALRDKVQQVLTFPAPTFMQQYVTDSSIQQIYQQLLQNGLVDASKITAETLFPPGKSDQVPQPFYSAPGSGYNSHHSYPGGLATHTAVNVTIVQGIIQTYRTIFGYEDSADTAVAGELLHDLAKPWVFQWQADGSSLPEQTIAGTGAHHIFSIAESIFREIPPAVITAQACAHNHPGTASDEAQVVHWIKAAAILAQKDPIRYGLLSPDGTTLPLPHKQAGFIVHLGDHDFVLSGPAAQQSAAMLKTVAQKEYGLQASELDGLAFHKIRNYVGAQFSFMRLQQAMSAGDPYSAAAKITKSILLP